MRINMICVLFFMRLSLGWKIYPIAKNICSLQCIVKSIIHKVGGEDIDCFSWDANAYIWILNFPYDISSSYK